MNATTHERTTATTPHERVSSCGGADHHMHNYHLSATSVQRAAARVHQERVGSEAST